MSLAPVQNWNQSKKKKQERNETVPLLMASYNEYCLIDAGSIGVFKKFVYITSYKLVAVFLKQNICIKTNLRKHGNFNLKVKY